MYGILPYMHPNVKNKFVIFHIFPGIKYFLLAYFFKQLKLRNTRFVKEILHAHP